MLFLLEVTLQLLEGLLYTLLIFAVTLLAALPLGIVIALGSKSKLKFLSSITRAFVWVIRGTPLMLQLFVVFYVPGLVFETPMRNRFLAALIAFVINYACYFAEIFRGGLQSIPKGQYEAGQVLGLTKTQVFFNIILMQTVKRIVPPMGNEIITLVKDTSLARVIAISEVIMVAAQFTTKGIIWPLFYTGVFFLLFSGLLTLLLNYIEKKLSYYHN